MTLRIAIVEDETIVADDLSFQLTALGHEVVSTAVSGDEAISRARDTRPDLVIMDFKLQGEMSGAEAAKIIQRDTGAAIIFMTAFPSVFLGDPKQMTAPSICLSKPFSIAHLQAILEAVGLDSRTS